MLQLLQFVFIISLLNIICISRKIITYLFGTDTIFSIFAENITTHGNKRKTDRTFSDFT